MANGNGNGNDNVTFPKFMKYLGAVLFPVGLFWGAQAFYVNSVLSESQTLQEKRQREEYVSRRELESRLTQIEQSLAELREEHQYKNALLEKIADRVGVDPKRTRPAEKPVRR